MTTGTLFTADFLTEGLPGSPAWSGALAPDAAAIEARFSTILDGVKDHGHYGHYGITAPAY